jgi:hypothetical protein
MKKINEVIGKIALKPCKESMPALFIGFFSRKGLIALQLLFRGAHYDAKISP